VRPEDVLHRLFLAPAWTIAERAGQAILVSVSHALTVLLRHTVASDRCLAEEGVLQVTSRVTLRLEQRVEVPEGGLDPTVSRHLVEAHRKKDFSELLAHFQKRVQVAALRHLTSRIDVGLLELGGLPLASAEHLRGELGLELGARGLVVDPLRHLVGLGGGHGHQLALLELVNHFLVMVIERWLRHESLQLLLISIFQLLSDSDNFVLFVTSKLDPLGLHGLGEADFGDLGANAGLNIRLEGLFIHDES